MEIRVIQQSGCDIASYILAQDVLAKVAVQSAECRIRDDRKAMQTVL